MLLEGGGEVGKRGGEGVWESVYSNARVYVIEDVLGRRWDGVLEGIIIKKKSVWKCNNMHREGALPRGPQYRRVRVCIYVHGEVVCYLPYSIW